MKIARTGALVACVLAVPGVSSAQSADDGRQACLDGAVHGQELLKSRHLSDARTLLVQCASEPCPGLVRRDCARWLDEAQAAQPSVVLSARDAQDHDVVDARVFVDGVLVPDALTGKAFDVDPGEHTLRIEREAKPPFEQKIPVHEGEKRQLFVLHIEPLVIAPVAPPPPPPRREPTVVVERAHAPLATYVFTAVGVASTAVFGAFAVKGIVDRGNLHCDTGCTQSDRSKVNIEFDVADVALGVGVAAFGVALWTFLARGHVTRSSAAFVQQPVGQWRF